jgi:hypothetical protein
MGLFTKKPDPITDRSRELNARIAALEAKIKKLNQELEPGASPRARGSPFQREEPAPEPPETPPPPPHGGEPIFENVDQNRLKAAAEPPATREHFNELGVRKYDLLSLLDRIRKQFQNPPAANPRLVNYLAAGSIQGLRPLRYEKRVARNRFMLLLAILGLVCVLIVSYALERHR